MRVWDTAILEPAQISKVLTVWEVFAGGIVTETNLEVARLFDLRFESVGAQVAFGLLQMERLNMVKDIFVVFEFVDYHFYSDVICKTMGVEGNGSVYRLSHAQACAVGKGFLKLDVDNFDLIPQ